MRKILLLALMMAATSCTKKDEPEIILFTNPMPGYTGTHYFEGTVTNHYRGRQGNATDTTYTVDSFAVDFISVPEKTQLLVICSAGNDTFSYNYAAVDKTYMDDTPGILYLSDSYEKASHTGQPISSEKISIAYDTTSNYIL